MGPSFCGCRKSGAFLSKEKITIRSVGFLLRETENTISIAQSYDDNKEPNPNGLLQIPRCSVRSVATIA
jgi:hypothetical protein